MRTNEGKIMAECPSCRAQNLDPGESEHIRVDPEYRICFRCGCKWSIWQQQQVIDLQCELDAVMVSVDKWFGPNYPILKTNPATRASDAREIALREIERLSEALRRIVELSGNCDDINEAIEIAQKCLEVK